MRSRHSPVLWCLERLSVRFDSDTFRVMAIVKYEIGSMHNVYPPLITSSCTWQARVDQSGVRKACIGAKLSHILGIA